MIAPRPKVARPTPRPPAPCPKCGAVYGFLHSLPRWHAGPGSDWSHSVVEHLDWHCDGCGFRVETPTADAESGSVLFPVEGTQ